MSDNTECIFTEDIGGGLSCSHIDNNFDEWGFTIIECPNYPCDKIKNFLKEKVK